MWIPLQVSSLQAHQDMGPAFLLLGSGCASVLQITKGHWRAPQRRCQSPGAPALDLLTEPSEAMSLILIREQTHEDRFAAQWLHVIFLLAYLLACTYDALQQLMKGTSQPEGPRHCCPESNLVHVVTSVTSPVLIALLADPRDVWSNWKARSGESIGLSVLLILPASTCFV